MKNLFLLIASAMLTTALFSFVLPEDPWKVPEKFEKMKNPVKSDAASVKAGREIYISHCKSCHGVNGKGDGPKASHLSNQPTDLTTADFQKQSDGSLFYKIYYGHKDMPSFKKRIPDNKDAVEESFGETRGPGDLINYIRTLNK
ncbi:MAG: c-type cytochrome [Bacteroidia bacterium]